jgi:hypothetical protein
MKIVMTLAAAAVTATAMVSSASAEGIVGCDSSLPTSTVTADSCRGWAASPSAPAAFAYAPARAHVHAPARVHAVDPAWAGISNKTAVHGGAGN